MIAQAEIPPWIPLLVLGVALVAALALIGVVGLVAWLVDRWLRGR